MGLTVGAWQTAALSTIAVAISLKPVLPVLTFSALQAVSTFRPVATAGAPVRPVAPMLEPALAIATVATISAIGTLRTLIAVAVAVAVTIALRISGWAGSIMDSGSIGRRRGAICDIAGGRCDLAD
jgi:hypothetical protein